MSGSIPEIDGLRALAVVSVLLFHVNAAFLPGGFTGVDVFFVISGFVVTASLIRHEGDTLPRFVSDFYARRIVRIFPALVVCLLVTVLLKALFIPASWLSSSSRKTALSAFFGLGNFGLLRSSDGYFSPRMDYNPFMHTWSLGVEEQYYFIYPIIFFLCVRLARGGGIKRRAAKVIIPALALLSLALAAYQTAASPMAAFYLLPSRFWELAAGVLLSLAYYRGDRQWLGKGSQGLKLWAGLVIVVIGFVVSQEGHFPFPWALLPVLGTVLLIAGILGEPRNASVIRTVLASPPVLWIGRRSYSIYLWHWPILTLMRWTVGLDGVLNALTGSSLSFLMGAFSYRWIEAPFRERRHFKGLASKWIIAIGLFLITVSSAISYVVFKHESAITLSQTRDRENWYPDRLEEGGVSSGRFEGRTLFTFGDSHANAYERMLGMIGSRHGARIVTNGQGGKPLADLLRPSSVPLKDIDWYQEDLATLRAEARPGDVVFLASLRMNRLCDQWGPFSDEEIEEKQNGAKSVEDRALALAEAEAVLRDLSEFPVTVVIDAPMPVLAAPPFRCSDWFNKMNPVAVKGLSVSREYLESRRAPVMNSLRILQEEYPALIVWDPFPVLCPAENFEAFNNGLPVLLDGDHLSGHGNQMLYPSFESLLTEIWSRP